MQISIKLLRILFVLLGASALVACSTAQLITEKPAATQPQIISFVAETSKIEHGQSLKLTWVVKNAEKVVIDHDIGEVPPKGYIEVRPDVITAYNLTASNARGTAGSAVIVNVIKVTTTSSPTIPPPALAEAQQSAEQDIASHVYLNGAILVGADGHYITLVNNPSARNPKWSELKDFLQKDQTDKQRYETKSFTCGDFAEMLHNNAEASGIRAGLMGITIMPQNMHGEVIKHSLNIFGTTDKGTVYIDVTSTSQGIGADKMVDVAIGNNYVPVSIFPQAGYSRTWLDMGRIESIEVIQW